MEHRPRCFLCVRVKKLFQLVDNPLPHGVVLLGVEPMASVLSDAQCFGSGDDVVGGAGGCWGTSEVVVAVGIKYGGFEKACKVGGVIISHCLDFGF